MLDVVQSMLQARCHRVLRTKKNSQGGTSDQVHSGTHDDSWISCSASSYSNATGERRTNSVGPAPSVCERYTGARRQPVACCEAVVFGIICREIFRAYSPTGCCGRHPGKQVLFFSSGLLSLRARPHPPSRKTGFCQKHLRLQQG